MAHLGIKNQPKRPVISLERVGQPCSLGPGDGVV